MAKEEDQLPWPELEPWNEAVSPGELLGEVSETIKEFIILEGWQCDAAALWVAFTHFIDVVDVSPLLLISAPERACGKSQLLDVVGRLSARPLPASNATAAAMFRAIDAWEPTVLVDEADTFIRENEDLKGIVNAGHTRANAFVLRTTGEQHSPKLFNVWAAKAFAGIQLERHLPDATMSRGILIEMRRKLGGETVGRLRHRSGNKFEMLTRKLMRLAQDYGELVDEARPYLPHQINDREQDNWEPLLAIAGLGGEEWEARGLAACLAGCGAASKPESTGNELLNDIREVFESQKIGKISTTDLLCALIRDDEKSWATYNRGKPLTSRQLGKQLSAYGITSKTVRPNSWDVVRGFDAEQFQDAFSRYLHENENGFSLPTEPATSKT